VPYLSQEKLPPTYVQIPLCALSKPPLLLLSYQIELSPVTEKQVNAIPANILSPDSRRRVHSQMSWLPLASSRAARDVQLKSSQEGILQAKNLSHGHHAILCTLGIAVHQQMYNA
jgi:hypothetical protein